MPEENPDAVGQAAQREPVAQAAQARILALAGQRLVDAKGDQADVDNAPNGKDVAGWYEVDRKAVRDFTGHLAVEGQGVGEAVDGQGNDDADDVDELTQGIFVHFSSLPLSFLLQC